MRGFIITIIALIISFQYAFADGFQETYSKALECFNAHKYNEAEDLFKSCLSDPRVSMNSDIQRRINDEITLCRNRINERERNARAVMQKERDKRDQRIKNRYVYLSVNTESTGDLYDKTTSAMSEVMRLNNRSFCPNIDDALTVVTVFIKINPDTNANGFFKATGGGFVRLGSAIDEKDFVGQWSVESEATSAVNMDDAFRLLRNKLNYKLSYALENLLNDRPQGSDFYIPEQSISVFFAKNSIDKVDLSYLRNALNGYISQVPDMTVSNALDETWNADRDEIFQIQAKYVRRESRAPIHELEGFGQVLRLSVKEESTGYVTVVGEISELGTGKTLSTVTVKGADFGISMENIQTATSQELVAKLLAVGFGFKNWTIGEDIGGFKLASFNGLHGLLLRVMRNDLSKFDTIDEVLNNYSLDCGVRYPSTEELLNMFKDKKKLGLTSIYWTSVVPKNKMHETVDFRRPSKKDAIVSFKDNKYAAALVLVKEF